MADAKNAVAFSYAPSRPARPYARRPDHRGRAAKVGAGPGAPRSLAAVRKRPAALVPGIPALLLASRGGGGAPGQWPFPFRIAPARAFGLS